MQTHHRRGSILDPDSPTITGCRNFLIRRIGWVKRNNIKTIKTEPRGRKSVDSLLSAERERIEAAIPRGSRVVVLDERGVSLRTQALAERLRAWQLAADPVALVIGGPDGLEPTWRDLAHERIRLSDLTLPHAMVRVLLIEQLYRAWSILNAHPYHRE